MNENNSNSSKQILISILGVAILIVAVVGISFAAFTYARTGTTTNTITTGTITMSYTEGKNGITLTDALPITDDAGKALSAEGQYFDFTVNAKIVGKGTTKIDYVITATEVTTSLPSTGVKAYLTSNTDQTVELAPTIVSTLPLTESGNSAGAPVGEHILKSGSISTTDNSVNETTTYRLRMWVDQNYQAPSTQQVYSIKVNVYGAAAAQ
ncbi:unknown [Clostridium sp. CAG:451]|nr:unknown [Clostridium sp. CAG:451]